MTSLPQRHSTTPPPLGPQAWLSDPALQDVFRCLSAGGYEARAVGGAVRNALMGLPIADVDVATTAPPEAVMRLADAGGLQVIATGLAHGTVTVIARHTAFEVTTLRRDIETDGRHARVTFSTDWTDDARRRDFTINALYCSADGTVHDPLGGWPDVEARRVRFIGDARERIREDFLRILRFFRFTAEYVTGEPDPDAVAACQAMQHGIDGLSGERLRAEMLKLLVAPRSAFVVGVMARSGILDRVVGPHAAVDDMVRLAGLEARLDRKPSAILRLAALAATSPTNAQAVSSRLKLSNAEASVLSRAAHSDLGGPGTSEADAKIAIYRVGREAFEDAMLLAWARSGAAVDDAAWRDRFALGLRFPRPVLPVGGSDVLALGLAPGPRIGQILHAFEAWWIENGFPGDPETISGALEAITSTLDDGATPALKPF